MSHKRYENNVQYYVGDKIFFIKKTMWYIA